MPAFQPLGRGRSTTPRPVGSRITGGFPTSRSSDAAAKYALYRLPPADLFLTLGSKKYYLIE